MRYLFLTLFMFASFFASYGQKSGMSEAQVKELVEGGTYFFRAQNMYPSGGKMRVLTEISYTMIVKPDEVSADLPYVGRAYQASVNPTDVGVKFTSKNFAFEKSTTKKGDLDIKISPKDNPDVRECLLTIYKNGNANLVISFNSRQNISYQGIILPIDQNK